MHLVYDCTDIRRAQRRLDRGDPGESFDRRPQQGYQHNKVSRMEGNDESRPQMPSTQWTTSRVMLSLKKG